MHINVVSAIFFFSLLALILAHPLPKFWELNTFRPHPKLPPGPPYKTKLKLPDHKKPKPSFLDRFSVAPLKGFFRKKPQTDGPATNPPRRNKLKKPRPPGTTNPKPPDTGETHPHTTPSQPAPPQDNSGPHDLIGPGQVEISKPRKPQRSGTGETHPHTTSSQPVPLPDTLNLIGDDPFAARPFQIPKPRQPQRSGTGETHPHTTPSQQPAPPAPPQTDV